jgi:hypothetical protein
MSQQTGEKSFNRPRLFTGEPQDENFARLPRLVHVKEMKPSKRPFELPDGPGITLPSTYTVDSVSKDLKSFLDKTHTSALFVLKDGKVRFEQY